MGARIMSLLGGPCTIGPGTVVGVKLKEFIRAHHDIINNTNNCKYMAKAKKYYESLTQRCMTNNITVDFFAFTLDQFGLVEMQTLPK
jgi:protein transport protein SEC23